MKKHKHNWDLGDEPCWHCGAYSEYCQEKDCHTIRECDADGNCEIVD